RSPAARCRPGPRAPSSGRWPDWVGLPPARRPARGPLAGRWARTTVGAHAPPPRFPRRGRRRASRRGFDLPARLAAQPDHAPTPEAERLHLARRDASTDPRPADPEPRPVRRGPEARAVLGPAPAVAPGGRADRADRAAPSPGAVSPQRPRGPDPAP